MNFLEWAGVELKAEVLAREGFAASRERLEDVGQIHIFTTDGVDGDFSKFVVRPVAAPNALRICLTACRSLRVGLMKIAASSAESAFIPFVSFGDLDNNTFKGLTSLLSVEQEIQYDEHT
jgi:hypothetical protein